MKAIFKETFQRVYEELITAGFSETKAEEIAQEIGYLRVAESAADLHYSTMDSIALEEAVFRAGR